VRASRITPRCAGPATHKVLDGAHSPEDSAARPDSCPTDEDCRALHDQLALISIGPNGSTAMRGWVRRDDDGQR